MFRYAEAHSDLETQGLFYVRKAVPQTLGQFEGLFLSCFGQEYDEFFPSPAGEEIRTADFRGERFADGDQDSVAHEMPFPVVEELEAIDVSDDQRKRATEAFDPAYFRDEYLIEVTPVEEARQRVFGSKKRKFAVRFDERDGPLGDEHFEMGALRLRFAKRFAVSPEK
jgi:hypothetical protein